MQNDHPHKFFKPFNGIDAIGRWSVLAASCTAAFFTALYFDAPYTMKRFDAEELTAYVFSALGIMIFFACGLGLCIRLQVARIATLILYVVFVIALFIFIISIQSGYTPDREIAAIVISFLAFLVVAGSTMSYLTHPAVKAEFDNRGIKPDSSAGRPHLPFIIGLAAVGFGLFALGLLFADEMFQEYEFDRAFMRLSGSRFYLGLLFFAGFGVIYGGLFVALIAFFLQLRRRVILIAGRVMAIYYMVLVPATFFSLSGELFHFVGPFIGVWCCILGLVLAYPWWCILRYLRSEQGIRTFTRQTAYKKSK